LPRRTLHVSSSGSGLLFAIRNVTGGVVGGVPPSSTAGHSGANGKAPPPRFGSGTAEPAQQPKPSFDSQQQISLFGQQADGRLQPQEQRAQEQRVLPPAKRGVFRRALPRLFLLCLFLVVVGLHAYFRRLRQCNALPYEERLKRRAAHRAILKRMGREAQLREGEELAERMHRTTAMRLTLLRTQMGVGLDDTLEGGEEAAAALMAHARPEVRMKIWRAVALYVLTCRFLFLVHEAIVPDSMINRDEQRENARK
jgi:hypothetical protein